MNAGIDGSRENCKIGLAPSVSQLQGVDLRNSEVVFESFAQFRVTMHFVVGDK